MIPQLYLTTGNVIDVNQWLICQFCGIANPNEGYKLLGLIGTFNLVLFRGVGHSVISALVLHTISLVKSYLLLCTGRHVKQSVRNSPTHSDVDIIIINSPTWPFLISV